MFYNIINIKLYGGSAMKKLLAAFLVILTVFTAIPFISASAAEQKKLPTPADLGGVENVCLTYTFNPNGKNYGRHTADTLKAYVGYMGKDGKVTDTFMDGYLFLPCVQKAPSGQCLHDGGYLSDWVAYIDDTFKEGYNVDALDKAAEQVSKELGRDVKCKVFLTILYPFRRTGASFGTLDGVKLNSTVLADRKKAIKWCIDEQEKRFKEANYKHLELAGFYWLLEEVSVGSDQSCIDEHTLVHYAVDYTHELGYKAIWIPHFFADNWDKGYEFDFDVVNLQPNLMFPHEGEVFTPEYIAARLPEATKRMLEHGYGMEVEMDSQVFSSKYERYQMYLRYGIEKGLMNSVKMYYQDGAPGVLYSACKADNTYSRLIYDQTYKYAKGKLTLDDIVEPGSFDDDGYDWISVGKPYTATKPYTGDGSMGYQQIDGKELTDGIYGSDAYGTEWHAFYANYAVGGKFNAVIDLGKTEMGISRFIMEFEEGTSAGIGLPGPVTFSVSTDGKTFREVGKSEILMEAMQMPRADLTLKTPVTARYVKAEFGRSGSLVFIFASEFAVGRAEDYKLIRGDVDGNGKVDAKDYMLLKRACLKTFTLMPEQEAPADINGDGKINANDYMLLKRACLGTYKIAE